MNIGCVISMFKEGVSFVGCMMIYFDLWIYIFYQIALPCDSWSIYSWLLTIYPSCEIYQSFDTWFDYSLSCYCLIDSWLFLLQLCLWIWLRYFIRFPSFYISVQCVLIFYQPINQVSYPLISHSNIYMWPKFHLPVLLLLPCTVLVFITRPGHTTFG